MAKFKKKEKTPRRQTRHAPAQTKGPTTNTAQPKQPPQSETTAKPAARAIERNIRPGADIPYERNAIPNPIPHFSASASDSGRIFPMGVTQFLTLVRNFAHHRLILQPVFA